jgi:hypothetical protein
MAARRNTTAVALDALTDLTLPLDVAVGEFNRITRRWTPINQTFVWGVGVNLRAIKLGRAQQDYVLMQWCDDGGR